MLLRFMQVFKGGISMRKGNRLFVIATLSIVFVLFFAIAYGVVFKNKITNKKLEQTRSKSTVQINWEELYPFTTTVETVDSNINQDTTTSSSVSKVDTILNKVLNKLKSLSTKNWATFIENYTDLARLGYIVNSRLTDPSIGRSYVRLKNGYWITRSSKMLLSDAQKAIAPYASLQKHLNKSGIPFLYFYAPMKECALDNELPNGIVSYTNEKIDTYLDVMNSFQMDYVDLRKNLHNDNLDHYEMFYVTDHHWTVEAGLWAASKIAQEVNSRFGFSMRDPYDVGEYNLVKYENAEFGSMGKGVTKYVAQSEDFIIPYPAFETKYRLEIPNKEIDVTGSFEEIFIDHEGLQKIVEQKGYTDSGSAYGQILYGNPPYQKITSLNNPDGPKVLMIRDSFSIVVAPYLAESCSELLMLDTRPDNGYFTGSIISCIEEFNPDIVLALQCSPQSITLNK